MPIAKSIGLALALAVVSVLPGTAAAQSAYKLRPDQAAVVRSVLAAAPAHGLPERTPPSDAPPAVLIAAVVDYAQAQRGGRLSLQRFPSDWGLRPAVIDAPREVAEALAGDRLAGWLQQLPPPHDGYRRLQMALAQYRGFAGQGGWAPLPEALRLKLGDRNPQVAALRRRLLAEGYLAGVAAEPELFDARLVEAVAIFQRLHGLGADGVVGPATIVELNVPVTARIASLGANLERWRWLPQTLPARRIEVNLAAATLEAFDAAEVRLTMRTVVGKPSTPSPMFSDELEAVVFNPPWNVPSEIAAKEIMPRVRKDLGFLVRNGFVRTAAGGLRQLPGPKSALGLIKFDLPNSYSVYLHDTPVRDVFDRDMRFLSHGCVRLQAPRDLALFVFADQELGAEQIDAAIAAGRTLRAPLGRPLPVFLLYRTAFVDAEGQVQFRKDVYRWDEKLLALIGGNATAAGKAPD